MRLHLALQVLADKLVNLLVVVKLVGADIHKHRTLIRNHIVLGSGIHYGKRHLGRSQELAYLLKLIVTNPSHIIQCLVDSVYSLVAGSMTALSVSNHIQHHQSLFGNSRVHAGRFTYDGKVDMRKQRQGTGNAILSRNLFFGRCQIDEIILLRLCGQHSEYLEERTESTAAIVAAQAVKYTLFYIR